MKSMLFRNCSSFFFGSLQAFRRQLANDTLESLEGLPCHSYMVNPTVLGLRFHIHYQKRKEWMLGEKSTYSNLKLATNSFYMKQQLYSYRAVVNKVSPTSTIPSYLRGLLYEVRRLRKEKVLEKLSERNLRHSSPQIHNLDG
jgi:hypothetical protein